MSERFDNELDRLLAGKLDGDLTPSEASRLEELLARDEQGRRELGKLERVDSAVRALGTREPELDVNWSAFRADVMARLCQQTERQTRRFPVYRIFSIAVPVAAAAAVLVAVMLHWSPSATNRAQVAHLAPEPVIQIAYHRQAEPASPATAGEISVTYFRSVELERATAARDAAENGGPSLAIGSGSRVATAATPTLAPEPFQL